MNDILQPDDPDGLVFRLKKEKSCIWYNTAWLSKQFYIIVFFDIYNDSVN